MLNQLCRDIHENSVKHGWWSQPRNPLEIHALIHSEISEATEAVRNGEAHFWHNNEKPDGEAVELMDAVIRIFDYFGKKGWDADKIFHAKHEYNKKRPYKHGGKLY